MKIPAGFHEFNMRTTLARYHINVAISVPENPTAIVQIIHGMSEHKERYYPFMKFLAEKGFATAIADNRGHGKSIDNPEDLGYIPPDTLFNYAYGFNQFLQRYFYTIPHFMIGHSMGSLIAMNCLQSSCRIDGLILLGNPSYIGLAGLADMLFSEMQKTHDGRYRSKKIHDWSEKFLNRNFGDIPHSWICSNPEVVMQFNNDPLCNFMYTLSGYGSAISLMKRAYDDKMWGENINTGLPIRFISGKDDPCMLSEEKFFESIKYLEDKGFKNISHKLYVGMRHEVLNETDKLLVWNDIADHLIAWTEPK